MTEIENEFKKIFARLDELESKFTSTNKLETSQQKKGSAEAQTGHDLETRRNVGEDNKGEHRPMNSDTHVDSPELAIPAPNLEEKSKEEKNERE